MTEINLNRHRVMLYGQDFEDYRAKVRLQLCYSIENKAALQAARG